MGRIGGTPKPPSIIIPSGGIRVPLQQISGLSAKCLARIYQEKPFDTFFDFVARVQPDRDELERLILCGALHRLEENRRAMLWAIPSALQFMHTCDEQEGCLPLDHPEPPLDRDIADFSQAEMAVYERTLLGLDIETHLMSFERERISNRGGVTTETARHLPAGRKAVAVGNPIRLRFPPTQSGKRVVFFDLEDETGLLNVTCFDDVYQRDGHAIICSGYVTIIGEAQDRDGHTAFLAKRVFAYHPVLGSKPNVPALPIKAADFLVG